jgi:hypothetical protein
MGAAQQGGRPWVTFYVETPDVTIGLFEDSEATRSAWSSPRRPGPRARRIHRGTIAPSSR